MAFVHKDKQVNTIGSKLVKNNILSITDSDSEDNNKTNHTVIKYKYMLY
jgi:hypothetical protein